MYSGYKFFVRYVICSQSVCFLPVRSLFVHSRNNVVYRAKFKNFDGSQFINFFFDESCVCCPNAQSQRFSPMFSPKRFIVSHFNL